jgi:beta-N-acetylhexosaminidase
LEARINRGEIPIERLDDAVKRVWTLKERFGLLDKTSNLIREMSSIEKEEAFKTAQAICEKAVTLVRDKKKSLPLNPTNDKRILVVGVTPISHVRGDEQLKQLEDFAQQLKDKGFKVDFRHNILYETQGWADDSPKKYDRIIIAVARTPHDPFGPLQMYDDEAQSVWAVNAMPKDKIIVVSFGSPYLINEYFERVNTCINAYSNTPIMHSAVIAALMGEVKMTGQSPVDLNLDYYTKE